MENMKLYLRRAECGRMSQRRLAQLADIPFDKLHRIEKGYTEPTAGEQAAIARVLDTTPEALFPSPVEQPASQESR